jgi:putative SOS response-associated peptidase YedK
MCYHASTPDFDDLDSYVNSLQPTVSLGFSSENYTTYYHVSGFSRPYLPVLLNNAPGIVQLARWKLLPFWVKTDKEAKIYANTLNANYEDIFQKKSYKPYILKNKGLLFVNGFYEPNDKEKSNYYFYMPGKQIFTLGIIYSNFTDKDTGETYPTFAIITGKENQLLHDIHAKGVMPLVIPEDKRADWLAADTQESTLNLMQPLDDGILQAHRTVRVTAMRNVNTNIPEIQSPV